MKKPIAEFIGTFFLVFTIALSGNSLAIGVVLMIMVYSLGYISGGYFNPAVTIGMFLYKKLKRLETIYYIIAQILGSVLALVIYSLISNKLFSPGIPSGSTFISALIIEIIFTFALVFVIFNVCLNTRAEGNQYFGLAIGLTLFVGATAGGAISGGIFNPAVGVVPLLINFQHLGENLTNILLYIVGPTVGSILAVFVFKYFNDEIKLKF